MPFGELDEKQVQFSTVDPGLILCFYLNVHVYTQIQLLAASQLFVYNLTHGCCMHQVRMLLSPRRNSNVAYDYISPQSGSRQPLIVTLILPLTTSDQ